MPKPAETNAAPLRFDPITHFTDRQRQIAAFDRLWEKPSPWILFLHGMSGNGKSTLIRYLIETRCTPQHLAYTELHLDSPAVSGDRFLMAAKLADGLRSLMPAACAQFDQQRRDILTDLENKRQTFTISQSVTAEAGGSISGVQQQATIRLVREQEENAYRRLAEAFTDLAKALPSRVVFFIDTYETLQRTDDRNLIGWLWNSVLERSHQLCPGLRVVVGSQDAPQLPVEFGTADDDLAPFVPADTRQLFEALGITQPGLAEAVQDFTAGHPLLVAMAAEEALHGHLTAAEIKQALHEKRRAEEWLFGHVIERLPEPHKTAVPWIALLRRFNHDTLTALLAPLGIKLDAEAFRQLEQFSFVRYHAGTWRCHDLIRQTQQRYQSERRPEETAAFYTRAWQYYMEQWQKGRNDADQLDAIYYHFLLEPAKAH
ncbi:MAG: ATP-binding protein, partial [candidate division KSB1 bacterium]|nr:ATP-binding protein [candidate division KSB1 bacterium]